MDLCFTSFLSPSLDLPCRSLGGPRWGTSSATTKGCFAAELVTRLQSSAVSGVGLEIVIILLLVLANGVFAMSEIAVVAARKIRLQQRADEGDDRAKAALALAHDPKDRKSVV